MHFYYKRQNCSICRKYAESHNESKEYDMMLSVATWCLQFSQNVITYHNFYIEYITVRDKYADCSVCAEAILKNIFTDGTFPLFRK